MRAGGVASGSPIARVQRRRPQLGDEAAAYVRDLIMSGQLRGGEFVRPEVVADELGISATPAREGLLALRSEGFLHLEPRRGFVVAPLTSADIRDLFAAQALLAGELAARAALKRDAAAIQELDELQATLESVADRQELEELEELNFQFHRRVNLLADAPKISWLLGVCVRYAPRRFYSTIGGWPAATVHDHRLLLDAFHSGSAEAARSAMAAHVLHAGELLAEHLERASSSPAAAPAGAARKALGRGT